MASVQDTKLENVIDWVLKSGDVQALDVFLQRDIHEATIIKCSQQFLTKLDKLVSRKLDQKDFRSASLGLAVLYKCGKNLKLPGSGQGLPRLIAQGLIKKMVQWFEKCRQLWIQRGPQWDETLFNLSEDFFDALMVIHEACKEGLHKITEAFLYPIGQLGVDPRIYVLIQKEAIRKFNFILDKIPVELKKEKKILTSQEASDIMIKLAGHVLEGGDYDLQTAVMEALCRMTYPEQRKELADRWFSMEHVAHAFSKIHDSEFETDCRKFLNLVNGMQGDKRRVYSYPCLEAYLDKHELLMPVDEKLEEFWIDFNLGSNSISFYFSLADEEAQEGQWETICINENEVESYTVTEESKRKVLQLKLSELVVVGEVEGSSLTIHFSSSLDIHQAARRVYGHCKDKGFVGKMGTSVVKTTVKIIMEENSSQVVPETQVSLGKSEKNTDPYILPALSAQMVTPAKIKISESTTFISNSAGGSVHGASSLSSLMSSDTHAKGKRKPSLEMVHSCDRRDEFQLRELRTTKTSSHGTSPSTTIADATIQQNCDTSLQSMAPKQTSKNKADKHEKNIGVAKAVDTVLAGQGEEQSLEDGFVPDTQPRSWSNVSSNCNKLSVSEMLMMPTQAKKSLPGPDAHLSLTQQQECLSSAQRFSVPGSGPVSQKQLCTKLRGYLQHIIREKNQDCAPQEPAVPQRHKSDVKEDSRVRSSADQCVSALCPSKKQQAKRNILDKEKSKGQMPLVVDSTVNKVSVEASTAKALQDRTPLSIKGEINRTLVSKEKRDSEVAGSMVKLISSRYKTQSTAENGLQSWIPPHVKRPVFNMSWLSIGKKDVSAAVSLMKSNSNAKRNSMSQRKNVFEFNVDAPLIIGGKDRPFFNTSATSSSGINESSVLRSTTKKGQPVAKERRHEKKHLFSDTDTDHAMTEVSWLTESARKPKPKVIKYTRQAPAKPKAISLHTSYESPDLPPPSPKHVKETVKPNKKKPTVKERVEQPKETVKPAAAPSRPLAAGGRPKRAAATSTKSYREPDTDNSDSENPPVPKHSSTDHLENTERKHTAAQVTKKKTASKQLTKSHMKRESNHHSSRSESESVSEQPPSSKGESQKTCPKVPEVKKRNTSEKSTDIYRRLDSNNQSHLNNESGLKRPENVSEETLGLKKKNAIPIQEQMNALRDSWAAHQSPVCPSTPTIERMRSAERSAPALDLTCSPLLTPRGSPLPASPDPACQVTPSPILLRPKPCSTLSSKGNLKPSPFYNVEKKHISSKAQSIRSVASLPSLGCPVPALDPPIGPDAIEISPVQQCVSPGPQSPLSTQPLLTSTLFELDKPSMPSPPQLPFPEDSVNHGHHYDYSKMSSVSQVLLSQSSTESSVWTSRVNDSPTAVPLVPQKAEKTPPSDLELKSAELHVSGPSRKRHISLSSSSEEEEKEERKKSKMRGQRSPRMKPRKLFKSFTKVSAEGEVSQVMSSPSHVVDGDMDEDLELPETAVNPSNLCQQFNSALKQKFQIRHKMMEVYNKQSLKTIQQHVSSLNKSVTKYRTQRLEHIQKVLLEEIHKLEQNGTVLKNMEKDLTTYWKEQVVAFHSYQEKENRRSVTLKNALQSNLCPTLEYEQKIFTSEMCLIRKDMKSVQERLLSEMQDEEIQTMKRGLHAFFFPDAARF
uniref:synaptonemal complex protein 2 isoform X3 n=1 Tax=Monopterus albus TaxID=43700 RepID=UPI0009B2ED74|nr:synaptonemal complex protein 2 isoform X3 [Monopterus albus]